MIKLVANLALISFLFNVVGTVIGAQQMAFDFVLESAMKELREYPRVQKDVKVCFEFVKWHKWDLDEIKKPITIRSYDISASGVRLLGSPAIRRRDLKRLVKGTKKIRMALYLGTGEDPLMSFARLIWTNYHELDRGLPHEEIQFGLKFIDVSSSFFKIITQYVEKQLGEKS